MIGPNIAQFHRVISVLASTLLLGVIGCSSPDALWREAVDAFAARDFSTADSAMTQLAKLRVPTAEDSMMRAQLAIARNQADEALGYLTLVPDTHPMAAQARLEQGQLELRRKRARFAETHLHEAIRLDPKLVQAHSELIYIYGMQLRRRALADEFRKLSELVPLTYDQALLWCLTRGSVWEPIEITIEMGKYLAADPDDHESRLALIESLRKLNRYDEAERALALLPADNPEARTARANLALDRGNEAEAETLLAGGPKVHLGLALLRGKLAMARGNTSAGVAAFRDAVAAEPNNRNAVFGLAHALQKADDPEAKRCLDESVRLERLGTLVQRAAMPASKNDPKVVRALGAACAEASRLPEARAWYRLAIQIDPLDTEAQQALFKLNDAKPPSP